MSERNRVPIGLVFNEGTKLTAWQSFSWTDDFTDPLGSLELETAPVPAKRDLYRSLLRKGKLVALYLDNVRQATMLITTSRRTISGEGYRIRVTCKGVLTTAYEGSADPYLARNFDSDTPVSEAVLAALASYGFDTIQVAAAENLSAMTGKALSGQGQDAIVDALEHKDVQVQPGEAAYPFAARIFTRYGLLLGNDVNGLLLLYKPDYQQNPAATVASSATRGITGADRFLAQPPLEIVDTNDGQFSEVVVVGKEPDKRGQTSASAPTHGVRVAGLERPPNVPFESLQFTEIPAARHTYFSDGGATYKPKFRFDKRARDKDRALNMATIMHGARASRAFQITGSVDGLKASSGRIWTSGTVVRVVIDEEGIDENMFVLANTKAASIQGQQTALTLIPLNSLVTGAE
jgi:prophage tail gpP-like protein